MRWLVVRRSRAMLMARRFCACRPERLQAQGFSQTRTSALEVYKQKGDKHRAESLHKPHLIREGTTIEQLVHFEWYSRNSMSLSCRFWALPLRFGLNATGGWRSTSV